MVLLRIIIGKKPAEDKGLLRKIPSEKLDIEEYSPQRNTRRFTGARILKYFLNQVLNIQCLKTKLLSINKITG